MVEQNFDQITDDNLEQFLDYHKNNPLPNWFPKNNLTREQYNSKDTEKRCVLVDKSDNIIEHGLTIVPYIKGHFSFVKTDKIAISFPFSGCLMSAFKLPNKEERCVAHIAKGDGCIEDELCDIFFRNTNINKLCVFDPHNEADKYRCKLMSILTNSSKYNTYGIITSTNNPYWLIAGTLDRKMGNEWYVIDFGEAKSYDYKENNL